MKKENFNVLIVYVLIVLILKFYIVKGIYYIVVYGSNYILCD